MYLKIHCDYETSERAGAGGMFQVASLTDDNDKDVKHLVDQGKHYSSLDDVKEDLAGKLNVPVSDIDLDEV